MANGPIERSVSDGSAKPDAPDVTQHFDAAEKARRTKQSQDDAKGLMLNEELFGKSNTPVNTELFAAMQDDLREAQIALDAAFDTFVGRTRKLSPSEIDLLNGIDGCVQEVEQLRDLRTPSEPELHWLNDKIRSLSTKVAEQLGRANGETATNLSVAVGFLGKSYDHKEAPAPTPPAKPAKDPIAGLYDESDQAPEAQGPSLAELAAETSPAVETDPDEPTNQEVAAALSDQKKPSLWQRAKGLFGRNKKKEKPAQPKPAPAPKPKKKSWLRGVANKLMIAAMAFLPSQDVNTHELAPSTPTPSVESSPVSKTTSYKDLAPAPPAPVVATPQAPTQETSLDCLDGSSNTIWDAAYQVTGDKLAATQATAKVLDSHTAELSQALEPHLDSPWYFNHVKGELTKHANMGFEGKFSPGDDTLRDVIERNPEMAPTIGAFFLEQEQIDDMASDLCDGAADADNVIDMEVEIDDDFELSPVDTTASTDLPTAPVIGFADTFNPQSLRTKAAKDRATRKIQAKPQQKAPAATSSFADYFNPQALRNRALKGKRG